MASAADGGGTKKKKPKMSIEASGVRVAGRVMDGDDGEGGAQHATIGVCVRAYGSCECRRWSPHIHRRTKFLPQKNKVLAHSLPEKNRLDYFRTSIMSVYIMSVFTVLTGGSSSPCLRRENTCSS